MEALSAVDDGPAQKTTFLLVPAEQGGGDQRLPDADPPGFLSAIYRLSDGDVRRFDALRAELSAVKQAGKRATLGLGIETFCRVGPLPGGPLLVTTYLRTPETGRYIVITDLLDLRQQDQTATALPTLEPCGE